VTPEPAENSEPTDLPDPVEGPLDPFDSDVPLAAGPDDVGFLRTPSAASRLLATFIDLFVAYFIVNVLDLIVILGVIHPGKKITASQRTSEEIAFNVAVLVVAVIFVLMERYTGRTIGRRMLRLRLVQMNGAPPTLGKLVIRFGVMFGLVTVPFGVIIALLGVLYAAVQPMKRTVFDLLAGTRVVHEMKSVPTP
jgi:uncharacterized RDD family membrane protein YckC